jgi:outer membrane PBP1 activator LpoA protein
MLLIISGLQLLIDVNKFVYLEKAYTFAPNKYKNISMKKLLAILVLAGALTACNNSSESAASSADSTIKAAADSMKVAADTMVKKMDSGMNAAVDSAKSKMGAAADKMGAAADSVKKAVSK